MQPHSHSFAAPTPWPLCRDGDERSARIPPAMTAPAMRSSAAHSLTQTQNSAPVHEHRCLYTHDLRRKQKRWQDGRLKFHTFNKRVMVYDDTSNLVGNTHWKEEGHLPLDEEITLDEGVLVQVGDVLATTQVDLAPLFERERKSSQQRSTLSTNARMALGGKTTAPVVQKHRSLNALLGTPKGSYGRAHLPESPFEARKADLENQWEEGPDPKRRRIGAEPWTITRTTKASDRTPLWAKTADARSTSNARPPTRGKVTYPISLQKNIAVKEVLDLTTITDTAAFSDVTLPSTPPKPMDRAGVSASMTAVRLSHSAIRQSRIKPASPAPRPPPSPPVSTTNRTRLRNIDHIVIPDDDDNDEAVNAPAKQPVETSMIPPPTAKKKQLRIAKSQSRPMLLSLKTPAISKPKEITSRMDDPSDFTILSDPEYNEPSRRRASQPKTTVASAAAAKKKKNTCPEGIQNVAVEANKVSKSLSKAANSVSKQLPASGVNLSNKTSKAKLRTTGRPIDIPKKQETGPWTVEATDLFDWRPPDWEERVKTMAKS